MPLYPPTPLLCRLGSWSRRGRAFSGAATRCGAWAGGFLLLLTGCSGFADERPPVADSTMVEVLAELHLAQSRLEVVGDLPDATRDSIFGRYGLDEAEYEAAMAYYAEHPEAYREIYDHLLDRLNMEAEGGP